MSKCPNHKMRNAEFVCMGCGKLYCRECVEQVHGVYFCKGCEDKAQEFVSDASYDEVSGPGSDSKYQIFDSTEDKKWEKTFDTTSIMELSHKDIKEFPNTIPIEKHIAGFFIRLAGYILDCIFFVPFYWILSKFPEWFTLTIEDELWPLVASGLTYTAIIFYRIIFEGWGGRTPGMMLTDIKIININGKDISTARGIARALATIIIEIPFLGWLVALLSFFFTPLRQCLNDIIAGTYVVRYNRWYKEACNLILDYNRKKQMGMPVEEATSQGFQYSEPEIEEGERTDDRLDYDPSSFYAPPPPVVPPSSYEYEDKSEDNDDDSDNEPKYDPFRV